MTIGGTLPLQRDYTAGLLAWIKNHALFAAMRDGIAAGEILPALRKNEVHFYEAGARLLVFSGAHNQVFAHARYIDGQGKRDRRLKKQELNSETLAVIRNTSRKHRDATGSELFEVHKLFPEFAITCSAHRIGDLALIDVETLFAPGDGLCASMIDLVFLLPDHRLLFIEAKCVGNREVRSRTVAKVVCQVGKYERHLLRAGVRDALNRSLQVQAALIDRDLGQATGIISCVPVLILDPDGRGLSPKSKDIWLKEALKVAPDWTLASGEVAVIDGMLAPAAAICEFVAKHLT